MPDRDARSKASTGSSESLSKGYLVYLAGGLFTQHELATNVSLKEAVWRLSNERFELVLPQSKELRQLDRPNLAAYLRNTDLQQVVQADILIARFDGAELDTGTVVEFMVAKMLGKPTVILRTDSRHLTSHGLDDPYNLMVKNWPRTIEINIDSVIDYIQMITKAREKPSETQSVGLFLEAELDTIRRGIDAIAVRIIEALNDVVDMKSPYPAELQEMVYKAMRYAPGAGFDKLLSEHHLKATLQKLMKHKTL
jgi:nucleoside 2-deoxyribosyltransferase